LRTQNQGANVPAKVEVILRESVAPYGESTREYQTGNDGVVTIADLPTPCSGTARITYNGQTITRPIAAIAGGNHAVTVDFAREVDLTVRVPENLAARARGLAHVSIKNTGLEKVDLKVALAASGVVLEQEELTVILNPGEQKRIAVRFTGGARVMPYLVRAVIVQGAPAREFHATGKIH
jgi:hypothetical protein